MKGALNARRNIENRRRLLRNAFLRDIRSIRHISYLIADVRCL